MPKILYLHHMAQLGGAERSLLVLVSRLDRRRFQPIFLCPAEGPFAQELRPLGITVIGHCFGRLRDLLKLLRSVLMVSRVIRSHEISLVHANGPQTNLPGALAARLTGIPAIWHARNLLAPGMIDLDRMLAVLPDRIICNSEAIRERFRHGDGRLKKSLTIYSGVDLKEFDPTIDGLSIRKELGIPDDVIVVAMASRLEPMKGQEVFLRAASEIIRTEPDVYFLIVGGTLFREHQGYEAVLQRLANELNIGHRVIFTGFRRDMPRILAAINLFVSAAEAEPFGRVLLEGMAMAKPIVATRTGGNPEAVVHGETGLLVPPGDPKALAQAIISLLSDAQRRETMGNAGLKRVTQLFSIERHIGEVEKIYESLLNTSESTPERGW